MIPIAKIRKMSPFELSEATTYCRSINNPYARELAIRAGIGEAYNKNVS